VTANETTLGTLDGVTYFAGCTRPADPNAVTVNFRARSSTFAVTLKGMLSTLGPGITAAFEDIDKEWQANQNVQGLAATAAGGTRVTAHPQLTLFTVSSPITTHIVGLRLSADAVSSRCNVDGSIVRVITP
jgi:hypothetical protein